LPEALSYGVSLYVFFALTSTPGCPSKNCATSKFAVAAAMCKGFAPLAVNGMGLALKVKSRRANSPR
jgi:hypothetical protein